MTSIEDKNAKIVFKETRTPNEKLYPGQYVALDKTTDKIYPISVRVRYHDNEWSKRTGEACHMDKEYHPKDLKKLYGIVTNEYDENGSYGVMILHDE